MEALEVVDDFAEEAADRVAEEVLILVPEVRCQVEKYSGTDRSLRRPRLAHFGSEEERAGSAVHHEARLLTGG
jgi:hypothetical protein